VNLLLDTHVLLWWLDDPAVLSGTARAAIADGGNPVFVSAAAVWEITIKKARGKLEAPDDLEEILAEERFQGLPITIPHALEIAQLPHIHEDPFDRIQVAQARLENLTLVTRDKLIKKYDISILEA
jgi:PIN domain nuclease of toxin-antitoxin system